MAVGLDIEWEIAAGPEIEAGPAPEPGVGDVRGEILVGRDRIVFDGTGTFEHTDAATDWSTAPRRRAWVGIDPDVERAPSAIVPLGRGARLERTLSTEPLGWSEYLELGLEIS